MKLEKNKHVSLVYKLREENADGRVLEVVEEAAPLTFIFGSGNLLPAFEANLEGKEEGSEFGFRLDASEAYGEKREEMVVSLPRNIFEDEGKLNTDVCFVGNNVPMMDAQGHRLNGIVTEIGDVFVKMDFNHPLAGCSLHFSGRVIGVRDATDVELMNLNPSGCSSCGSRNSGCGGSCS